MFLTNFFTIVISTKTAIITDNTAVIHTNILFSEFIFSVFTLFLKILLLDFKFILPINEVLTRSVIFVVTNLFCVDFCLAVIILVVGSLIVVLLGSSISFIFVED